MRSVKWKFALIVSLLLNVSFLVAAGFQYFRQSKYGTSSCDPRIKKEKFIFEGLSLKPDQAKAMREKAVPYREEINKGRYEIALMKKKLIKVMRADHPDVKTLDAITAEISRMQENMQRKITTHILKQKALLDKEQQGRFLDLLENAMTEEGRTGCLQTEHH